MSVHVINWMKIDKNYSRRFHLLTTLSPTPAVRPRRFCCLKMALTVLTLVSIKGVIIISWKNNLIHWRLIFYMFCKNHSPYTKHLMCNIVVQNKNNMHNTRRATSYLKCIMILQKTMTCIFLLFAFHRENSYSKRPSLRLCSLFRGRDILTFGKCMLDLLSV